MPDTAQKQQVSSQDTYVLFDLGINQTEGIEEITGLLNIYVLSSLDGNPNLQTDQFLSLHFMFKLHTSTSVLAFQSFETVLCYSSILLPINVFLNQIFF